MSEPRLRLTLQNLAWPAVAGNVTWSVFQLVIDKQAEEHFWGRLVPLLFLAAYLITDWIRTMETTKTVTWGYVICDVALVTTIGLYAIAAQQPHHTWLLWMLAAVFFSAVVGHGTGAWPKDRQCVSYALAGLNALGLVVLGGSCMFMDNPFPWSMTFALASVLIPWWLMITFVDGS